jgi:thiol-disulfide isomerase/thioredoxin
MDFHRNVNSEEGNLRWLNALTVEKRFRNLTSHSLTAFSTSKPTNVQNANTTSTQNTRKVLRWGMSKAEKHEPTRSGKGTFYEEIKRRDKAFVLFYASWCPFSQRFLPIFEEYARSNPQECMRVMVDDRPELCEEYSIEYYPTVLVFEKGKVCLRLDAEPGIGLTQKQLQKLTTE